MVPKSAADYTYAVHVLVAGWIGAGNLGDELVFSALRRKLEARDALVTPVSVDIDHTRASHRLEAVRSNPIHLWHALPEADAVVFGGGGLLQDLTSAFNLPYHLARTWLARARSVPVAGVGLGVDGLRRPISRSLVRSSLRRFAAVSVRDAVSAAELAAIGVPAAVVAADLALSLPLPDAAPVDEITVALRPFVPRDAVLPVAVRRSPVVPEWFLAATAGALDDLARRTGLGVRFVALDANRDDTIHRLVADRMQTAATCIAPGLDNVVAEIAAARLVVAMRYHAAIAATLAGRPVLCLGYAPKVDALAAELGDGGALVSLDEPSICSLAAPGAALVGRDEVVLAARDDLRRREQANDLVLDRLADAVSRTR